MDSIANPTNQCIDVAQYLAVNFNDQTAQIYVQAPIAVVYILIFLAGLSGNILVIASVCRHRALQTVRNFFIVSLSCSDIVVCLTSLPITPLTFILKNWIFGLFLCYAFPLVQGMSVCISTFTLTAVAVDRYILIIFPTKRPIQRNQAVLMIGAIWALAAGVSLPMVVHYRHFYGPDRDMDVQPDGDEQKSHHFSNKTSITRTVDAEDEMAEMKFCGYFCEEVWPSERVKQIYGSFVMILQFLVPLTIISFCYAHICIRLAARDGFKKSPGSSAKSRRDSERSVADPRLSLSQEQTASATIGFNVCAAATAVTSPTVTENRRRAVLRRKKRTNRMLIGMVVIFGVCWAPQVLMNILRDLGSLPKFVNDQMYFYSLICHSVAMSSTIWNPLLYAWMNETFRRSFLELLPCIRKCQRKVSIKKRGKIGSSPGYHHVPPFQEIDSQWDGGAVTEQYITVLVTDKKPSTDKRKPLSNKGSKNNSPLLTPNVALETKPLLNEKKLERPNFMVLKNGSVSSPALNAKTEKTDEVTTCL